MMSHSQQACVPCRRPRQNQEPHDVGPLMRTTAILFWVLAWANVSGAETPTGTVVGHVTYAGPSIPDEVVEVTRDRDYCGTTATNRTVSLNRRTGGLEGAVVSIDVPSAPVTESTASPVVIANNHCAFAPKLVVARVDQPVEIRNDDPVMHNTHLTRDRRTFLNVALVPAGRPVRKPLTQPGIYTVACDAHKFMKAHIVVLPHEYVSVTDGNGAFRIPHLPPGDHTLTIWHGTLGTIQRHITVPARSEADVRIEYAANAGTHDK
jgi:plastocyanin